MEAEKNDALTRIEAGQEATTKILETHGDLLRTIVERLDLLLEKLTPQPTDGPTLHELLAEMVVRLGDQAVLLNRIDRRTESMTTSLPADVVKAMTGAAGTNGAGQANGHARS